ncbi:AlkZ-related protein [Paenibacillus hexagrammi]|uniref:Uncharacterized protein n=1 Tax=Paenibacillus hexagrammi TaxID=2908839 RepID=A0ABY3SDP6_9BACL|nr:hypothetical protein [Paenibacillus sp. YPD9-1]UJF31952.1 hypothetical protein L0M14_19650 [Paenibacillus sp. YPD9-1]
MISSSVMKAATYEEAIPLLKQIGILPLSSFIPEHPSLEAITEPSQWHNGLETDPWLWRDRFAGDGIAAYGRFFAKKPVLISAEWFPLVKNLLEEPYTVEERYQDGLIPKAAVDIYQAVADDEGIDARLLRAKAGLKAKESKGDFDRALIELQSKTDLVIAGTTDRLNQNGVKSGWNSSCYMTAAHWMELHKLEKNVLPTPEAKSAFRALLREHCSEAAQAYFYKIFRL